MLYVLAVNIALLFSAAVAYPGGAGSEACDNLIPLHGGSAQNSRSPYTISLNTDRYTAGGEVELTLSGSQSFNGFLLIATNQSDGSVDQHIGRFEGLTGSENVQSTCGNNGALTHDQKLNTNSLQVKWIAPSNTVGNVLFFATFVGDASDIYWVKVYSDPIWDGVGASPTPYVTTTAESTTAGSVGSQIDVISPDVCGDSRGCWSDCEGNQCGYLVTYKKEDDDKYSFELFAGTVESGQYAALGLAPTKSMEDVSIIACTPDGVKEYYAAGRSPPQPVSGGPTSGSNTEFFYNANDKTMSCRFTYDNSIAKASPDQWKDFDKSHHSFLARGNYAGGSLLKHNVIPDISPDKVDFSAITSTTGSAVNILIKAHGALMIIAWVLCASIGIMMARYYKPMWVETKACGQKVWFQVHRGLMLATMFIAVIAFVLILIEKDGLYVLPAELPKKAHPIIGLIALICSFLNPLLAAFRPHPGTKYRPVFNWVHWFFGTVAHVFAIVAIFLGMLFTDQANIPGWLTYIMMAFCLVHVLAEFILEIHYCCMYDRNRDRQEQFELTKRTTSDVQEPPFAGRGFRCGMLVIYCILTIVLALAMVIIVAVWR